MEEVGGSRSHDKLTMEMERSTQALHTFEGLSSCRRGKANDSSEQNDPCMGKEKEKLIILCKSGFDYITCSQKKLEDRILKYTPRPFEVSWEALGHECSLGDFSLRSYLSYLSVNPPYIAHLALDNKHPFFHVEGEIGVYLGHFMAGLGFFMDSDLLEIL